MGKIIRIQPAAVIDNITADGGALRALPHPVCVREDGSVENYGREHPKLPAHVIGFQNDLAVQRVDVLWDNAKDELPEMVGKYLVTVDGEGVLAVHMTAISDIAIIGDDKPTPTIDVYCSFCGAKPGDPCRSVGNDMYSPMANRVLNEPHSNRIRKEEQQ